MAFFSGEGIGIPISPAFSIIERVSLTIKAMHTAFFRYSVPISLSSRQDTSSISSTVPLRQSPLKPALLSSAPLSDFSEFLKTPATITPVI